MKLEEQQEVKMKFYPIVYPLKMHLIFDVIKKRKLKIECGS